MPESLGTIKVGVKNSPQCAGIMLPTRAERIPKNACTLKVTVAKIEESDLVNLI